MTIEPERKTKFVGHDGPPEEDKLDFNFEWEDEENGDIECCSVTFSNFTNGTAVLRAVDSLGSDDTFYQLIAAFIKAGDTSVLDMFLRLSPEAQTAIGTQMTTQIQNNTEESK